MPEDLPTPEQNIQQKVLYDHSKTMDTDRTYVHEIEKSPEEIRAEQEKTKRKVIIIDSAFLSLIKESIDKT